MLRRLYIKYIFAYLNDVINILFTNDKELNEIKIILL